MPKRQTRQNSYLNSFRAIKEELSILPMPKTTKGKELAELRNLLLDIEKTVQTFLDYIDKKQTY